MAGTELGMPMDTANYQHPTQPSFQFNTDPCNQHTYSSGQINTDPCNQHTYSSGQFNTDPSNQHTYPSGQFNPDPSNQHTYSSGQFNPDPSNQHTYPSIQFNMDPGYQHAYPNTMDQIGVMPEDGAKSGYHGNYNHGYQAGYDVWSVNTGQPDLQLVQPGFDGQPPAGAAVYQDKRETVPIPNYVPCSIFTIVCCCFLLGAAGLYYAVTAKRENQERKFLRARKSATRSCMLNFAAILIGLACYGVIIYVVYTHFMKASRFNL